MWRYVGNTLASLVVRQGYWGLRMDKDGKGGRVDDAMLSTEAVMFAVEGTSEIIRWTMMAEKQRYRRSIICAPPETMPSKNTTL